MTTLDRDAGQPPLRQRDITALAGALASIESLFRFIPLAQAQLESTWSPGLAADRASEAGRLSCTLETCQHLTCEPLRRRGQALIHLSTAPMCALID